MRILCRLTICLVAVAGLSATPAALRAQISLLNNDRLIEAVNANDLATAETLLGKGHFTEVVDEKRRTPLILAASRGHEDLVDALVRFRANVNAADEFGNTALFYAASGDHIGIIEILLEAEAAIDAKNRQGVTALMGASSSGRLAAVEKLLANKADPAETDFTGRTARDWASRNNRRLVVDIFERRGIRN
tara:strand:- start:142 stop:714 length:573 start_codon:yes stop_codon:yes gene_type:complete